MFSGGDRSNAHEKFKGFKNGKNADYIPILATVPSELFGVVIALRDGTTFTAGDVDYAFAIESVSKPFTAALVMQQYGGPQSIIEKIGVEPTGLPCLNASGNSVRAQEAIHFIAGKLGVGIFGPNPD